MCTCAWCYRGVNGGEGGGVRTHPLFMAGWHMRTQCLFIASHTCARTQVRKQQATMAQRSISAFFFHRTAPTRTSRTECGQLEAEVGQCSQAKSPRLVDSEDIESDTQSTARPFDIGLVTKPGMPVKEVSTAVEVLTRSEKYELLCINRKHKFNANISGWLQSSK